MKPTSLLVLALLTVSVAQAQPVFVHSKVEFDLRDRIDLDVARESYDGNVLVYFYRKGHPRHVAADSVLFGDERVGALLNEKYARYAIDLDSPYAGRLFSRFEPGGPTDEPFILVISLRHDKHRALWGSWEYRHPASGADKAMLDQTYWRLSNFAANGTFEIATR